MSWNLSPGQVSSGVRHVYTVAGTVTALLGGLSLLTPAQVQVLLTAIHNIGDGIVSIATGVAALVPFITGAYAMWSASHTSRLTAIAADPQTVPAVKQAVDVALASGSKP